MNAAGIFSRVLLVGLLCPALLRAGDPAKPVKVDAKQIEVNLVPEESTIFAGEPIHLLVIVKNISDCVLEIAPKRFTAENFGLTVIGEDGLEAPKPRTYGFGPRTGMHQSFSRRILQGQTCEFSIYLPNWAKFGHPGKYWITAKGNLEISPAPEIQKNAPEEIRPRFGSGKKSLVEEAKKSYVANYGTNVPVEAVTEINVLPSDRETVGKIVDDLGSRMLSQKDRAVAFRLMDILAGIHDERVIPYWIKVLESPDIRTKHTALEALSDFDDDSAFNQGLRI